MTANDSGAETARQTYYPFGAVRTTSGTLPTDYTFTGQKLDASAGLMYYGARYYAAEIGRFAQPDSILPDPYNPQSLNRYSYVRNNPVRYTDPTGHCDPDDCRFNRDDNGSWYAEDRDAVERITRQDILDTARAGTSVQQNNEARNLKLPNSYQRTLGGLLATGESSVFCQNPDSSGCQNATRAILTTVVNRKKANDAKSGDSYPPLDGTNSYSSVMAAGCDRGKCEYNGLEGFMVDANTVVVPALNGSGKLRGRLTAEETDQVVAATKVAKDVFENGNLDADIAKGRFTMFATGEKGKMQYDAHMTADKTSASMIPFGKSTLYFWR